MSQYRNILIYYKKFNNEAEKLAFSIMDWLKQFSAKAIVREAGTPFELEKTDLAIALSGDGTMLGLARILAGTEIPVFGVNFGRVGFLASAERSDWRQVLAEVLEGRAFPRNCLILKWKISRGDRIIAQGVAINDFVVSRCSLARLVNLRVNICGRDTGILRSDGIIVSTPLGSSGYNISAGGPILYPDLEAICLTPVCPFPLGITPLVFPQDAVFKLIVDSGSSECYATIDGQEGEKLNPGDIIFIEGWAKAISIFSGDKQFFAKLAARGFALER